MVGHTSSGAGIGPQGPKPFYALVARPSCVDGGRCLTLPDMGKLIRTESELWTAMQPIIERLRWFGERIEDRTKSGMPDCYIGAAGKGSAWVELKAQDGGYRQGQEAWAIRAADRGERTVTLRCSWDQAFIVTDTAATARANLFGYPPPPVLMETRSLLEALCGGLWRHETKKRGAAAEIEQGPVAAIFRGSTANRVIHR